MHNISKANRLIHEKSPYLQQHAHNPVDWYPWGSEAFEKAKKEDKPIFLSIGYSTCHWCHLMERESFEDIEVANLLNQNFVPIKVDREERPDVDNIYMTACQALTGSGGWPLTVFMTYDGKPFFTGTYFPKKDHSRLPGLMTILEGVSKAWKENKETLLSSGNRIVQELFADTQNEKWDISPDPIHDAFLFLTRSFDRKYGGFGSSPKFPTSHNLLFLLRYWYNTKNARALEMVETTLESMYKGGIYDHIGHGFSRYSTDNKWLVPHFEKMLYDNALLAIAYTECYHATKKDFYKAIVKEILDYVLRDMVSPEGGFYSAEDADSEGIEGLFYVWTPDEIKEVLGEEKGEIFCRNYDITFIGNFEGKSIPNLIKGAIPQVDSKTMEECKKQLFLAREKRVHPFKDDKILTSWNGLMIAAMSSAGRVLKDDKYTNAAKKAADFLLNNLMNENGRLLARYRNKESSYLAYIDDYAFLIWGLVELYENTYAPEYLKKALNLCDDMLDLFWDNKNGGFFVYGNDSEKLIARPKEIYDGATPSGNSVAAYNLVRLSRLSGRHELEEKAQKLFEAFGENIGHSIFMIMALMYHISPSREVVIAGRSDSHNTHGLLGVVRDSFMPFTVSMLYTGEHGDLKDVAPFVEGMEFGSMPAAYVCENLSCMQPITEAGKLSDILTGGSEFTS